MELEAFISRRRQTHAAYELVTLALLWSNYIRVWERAAHNTCCGFSGRERKRGSSQGLILRVQSATAGIQAAPSSLALEIPACIRSFGRCLANSGGPEKQASTYALIICCGYSLNINTLILQTILLDSIIKKGYLWFNRAFPALCNLEIIAYWHISSVCDSVALFLFLDNTREVQCFDATAEKSLICQIKMYFRLT